MNPVAYWFRYFFGLPVQRYDELPGSRPWSPGKPEPVDRSRWKPCGGCRHLILMVEDVRHGPMGTLEFVGTQTYVCPLCGDCQVGMPPSDPDALKQLTCHECRSELGTATSSPKCSFPRGWMRVKCPYCDHRQPVFAPHWLDQCDAFHLDVQSSRILAPTRSTDRGGGSAAWEDTHPHHRAGSKQRDRTPGAISRPRAP